MGQDPVDHIPSLQGIPARVGGRPVTRRDALNQLSPWYAVAGCAHQSWQCQFLAGSAMSSFGPAYSHVEGECDSPDGPPGGAVGSTASGLTGEQPCLAATKPRAPKNPLMRQFWGASMHCPESLHRERIRQLNRGDFGLFGGLPVSEGNCGDGTPNTEMPTSRGASQDAENGPYWTAVPIHTGHLFRR